MNYPILRAEIRRAAYSGMSDAEIAAALNAASVAARVDVTGDDLRDVLRAAELWGRYVLASRLAPTGTLDEPSAQDLRVARIIELVTACEAGLRLSRAGVRNRFTALLDAMIDSRDMTVQIRAALLAPMVAQVSRASELGLGEVSAGDVATARATIA